MTTKIKLIRKYYLENTAYNQIYDYGCKPYGRLIHKSNAIDLIGLCSDIDLNKGDKIIFEEEIYNISSKAAKIDKDTYVNKYDFDIIYFVEKKYIIPENVYDEFKEKSVSDSDNAYLAAFNEYEFLEV